jgi:hypothetical protein
MGRNEENGNLERKECNEGKDDIQAKTEHNKRKRWWK